MQIARTHSAEAPSRQGHQPKLQVQSGRIDQGAEFFVSQHDSRPVVDFGGLGHFNTLGRVLFQNLIAPKAVEDAGDIVEHVPNGRAAQAFTDGLIEDLPDIRAAQNRDVELPESRESVHLEPTKALGSGLHALERNDSARGLLERLRLADGLGLRVARDQPIELHPSDGLVVRAERDAQADPFAVLQRPIAPTPAAAAPEKLTRF